jgi:hypothetical protein
MGRDHTIHASVKGFVKYYRDPARHPKRQYIGVTFTREEKLPYPPGLPRKRKLGMVAVPRKTLVQGEDLHSPSGIPRYVVRHEGDVQIVGAEVDPEVAEGEEAGVEGAESSETTGLKPVAVTDRNGKFRTIQKRIAIGQGLAYERNLKERKGTRVFRLQDDYSYRETNWEIGRLVGPAGKVGGTGKNASRKSILRARRKRRALELRSRRKVAAERAVRRHAHYKYVAGRKAIKAAEMEKLLAVEKAKREAAEQEDAKVRAGQEKQT